MTLVVGPPLPVQRARGGVPQHSAPVPPLRVEHPRQRAAPGSQEESLSLATGLSQVDARLKSKTVNLYAIWFWIEASGGISRMGTRRKRGLIHPYPNPSLHH